MEAIINRIFNGKEIIQHSGIESEKYASETASYEKLYKDLKSSLATEQQNLLDELLESRSKNEATLIEFYFEQGFKLGIQLMLESLT